jgi:hypothetical protein
MNPDPGTPPIGVPGSFCPKAILAEPKATKKRLAMPSLKENCLLLCHIFIRRLLPRDSLSMV